MSDPSPTARVFVTVGGVRHELVPTDKLTFPETKELKRVSEGMSLKDIEDGIPKGDPDAWFAWLYVSIRRSYPALTPAELMTQIGDTPIIAVMNTMESDAPEVAGGDPPARLSPSAGLERQNDNDSGETTPEPSILATAGVRVS